MSDIMRYLKKNSNFDEQNYDIILDICVLRNGISLFIYHSNVTTEPFPQNKYCNLINKLLFTFEGLIISIASLATYIYER